MLDLTVLENRKEVLEFFEDNSAEEERVKQSVVECDIFEGRIKKHVMSSLKSKYDADTVKEMDNVDMINMAKRVAKQEGSIYKDSPTRNFAGLPESDKNLKNWYSKTNLKSKLLKSNRLFKLQAQGALYVPLVKGKPKVKVLKKHQFKVYQDGDDFIYLIPNTSMVTSKMKTKEEIRRATLYTVWSEEYNFVMNGEGEIIAKDEIAKSNLKNPISPVVPIIDIAYDFEESYWTNEQGGLAEFTVLLNCTLADILHIMRMQGFAIGTLKGAPEVLEKIASQQIGPNKIIKIPSFVDKKTNTVIQGSMDYISPSPDLAASLQVLESLTYAFLTSRGVDPKSFSLSGDSQTFSSGWERLLSLIEKFEASKEDLDLYRNVEASYFEIIKAYCKTYIGSSELHEDFSVSSIENVTLSVEFNRPEMVETESERTTRIDDEVTKGFKSKLQGFMEKNRIDDRKEALKRLTQLKKDEDDWNQIMGPQEVAPEPDSEDTSDNEKEKEGTKENR